MNKVNLSIAFPVFLLVCFGLLMVFSASVFVAENLTNQPFYFGYKHIIFILLGILSIIITSFIPSDFYARFDWLILIGSILLLCAVFLPSIGYEVNGSKRWINLIFFKIQPSELAKLAIIIYVCGYCLRRNQELASTAGFLRPLILLSVISTLVMAQPDLGTTLILCLITVVILFFAGISVVQFLMLTITILGLAASAIFLAPWRIARLTSFIDPFQTFMDSGWQLSNALIGSGRGELFGVGLGASIQKNLYLPEPHTDFIFSIIVEELGMVGGIILIIIFGALVYGLLKESSNCFRLGRYFQGLFCFGVGILISIQTMFNIGVNIGLLPTKGLTLPFISYGGASLITFMTMIGISLRISFENNNT